VGKRGEELAAAYLAKVGYKIIERNYRCVFGELDIVAEEGGSIVFIEVKSRRSVAYGDPQLAVDFRKQKKISMAALDYLEKKHQHNCNARFDVVAVKLLPAGTTIELIKNAFELAF